MPGDPTIESEIGHLDFPVEEPDPKKKLIHFHHPTTRTLTWCGETVERRPYGKAGPRAAIDVNCVGCLQLAVRKGFPWWWQVHNLFYGSTCDLGRHNCGS